MKKNDILENLEQLFMENMDPGLESDDLLGFIEDKWKYLVSGLGINFTELLGCGANGCAFSTNDPNVVAKLTVDEDELNYYDVAQKHRANYPIFPEIFLVKELGTDRFDWNWFLVLRERIRPIDGTDFYKNIRAIKQSLKPLGLRIGDLRYANVGRSTQDDRLVLFDGKVM